ncbi:heme-binding domain-containing protein [Mariniphaga sp.]|uniref:heme-binding domain-containing protein n=1 Tax=Mariniphaga sp. TaxID=1954475 RepID=UPI003565EA35
MKKFFRIFIILLIAIFVVIQFFQPEKNRGEITKAHLLEQGVVDDEMKTVLKNACLDCHSNQTTYLWYHQIAPVSWMINQHITDGKAELNLSEWGNWEPLDQIGALDKMADEIKSNEMPLKPYVLMHPKAKLTEEQKEQFYAWAEKLSEELLIKMINE